MQLQPGTYLQGDKYRIIRCLGNGGFGITYLAEHELAGRNVCIKEFFPKEFYNRNEDLRSISLGSQGSAKIMDAYKAKFMKEAKTIARLKHPNIIHIHDVFAENNTAYYVMEYIEGESLSDLVKRCGVLEESVAVKYIRSVAKALDYIHERKIMHLDIKPANVMLNTEDGQVVVIDFGLSKQYDEEGNQTSSTLVGISAGYAPMEQYQQGGVKEFSPETDIYSLGATLYYIVTGNVPPQAVNVADDGLPELPAHLSSGVCNAIERSMEIQRKRRPQSIKEFLVLLEDNSPKVAVSPMPASVGEEIKIEVQAAVVEEKIAISTPQPKTGISTLAEPRVEPNRSDKKKSKWWLWLLIVAIVAIGGYFALNVSQESETSKLEQARIAEEQRIDDMIAQGLGRDGVYEVGDYYNRDGKEGIVFEVSGKGTHGKIVSVDQTFTNWWDATKWCSAKGADWYLPSVEELASMYDSSRSINEAIASYGPKLVNDGHWSSTKDGGYIGRYFSVTYAGPRSSHRDNSHYVRAVSAF